MSAPTLSHAGAGPDPAAWIDVTAGLIQDTDYNRDCAFARVLITFDPARRHDLAFIDRMLSRVSALRGKQSLTADEQTVLDLVAAPPDKSRWQRWELPRSVTDGVQVYLCELPLYFNRLPYGADTLDRPGRELSLLPCRAKPAGGVELLPYTLADLRAREDEFVRLVSRTGVRLTAVRVQANGALYAPGTRSLPGLVLITFDANLPNRDFVLTDLAQRVFDLKEQRPRNEDEREVREIVMASEQRGVRYRRRPLPRGFTGGPVVYAADLIIRPHYLRHGYLTDAENRLPVVAEPGPNGAIELLPYWEVTGEAPPKDEEPAEVLPVEAPVVAPAGDWVDVTDAVLAAPEPVPVVQVAPGLAPRKKKGRVLLFAALALLLFGGAFVCAGGGALWYFLGRAPVHLSNARAVAQFGFRQAAAVDFEFRRGPDPSLRYSLVVRNRRTGQSFRQTIATSPGQTRGTWAVPVPVNYGFGFPQSTEYDVFLDAAPANGSAPSEKVSNTLVVSV
jgi:hypothetical protein